MGIKTAVIGSDLMFPQEGKGPFIQYNTCTTQRRAQKTKTRRQAKKGENGHCALDVLTEFKQVRIAVQGRNL